MTDQMTPQDLDDCPVSEFTFARLLGTSLSAARELAKALPEDQRSRLAVYCYRRAHLRRLGLSIAKTCSKHSLVEESGHAGELIHFQAQNMEETLAGDRYMAPRHVKRPVSLHNC
ncbi:hypothetical protein [Roseibium algae]|uniref:Uncharacterized protein n=1 Tax=Roseibium algae TaxID=3123038 RepID=A0ABU8THA7_9HYPH